LSVAANPNRVRFYLETLVYEWLLFVLVVARPSSSFSEIIGVSFSQVLLDIGIAVGLWIVAAILLWIFGWLLRVAALGRNVSMLPQRGLELTVWIALSITAAFARRQSFEVTRNSSSWLLLRALPSVFSFLLRHSAGLRVSGIPDDDSDRSVRNQVRDSGLSVPKHSSWNDRPCMAGFIEWGARHPNEALEFEWCCDAQFIESDGGLRK
jgi:hypothetical protein